MNQFRKRILPMSFCLAFVASFLFYDEPLHLKIYAAEPDNSSQTLLRLDEEVTPGEPPAGASFFRVIGHSPFTPYEVTKEIVLFFNEPVDWTSVAIPVRVEPSARYEVHREDYSLRIVLPSGFPEEEPLRVTLSPALRSRTGAWLHPESRAFGFSTREFKPLDLFVVEETPDRTVLGVNFSYPVSVESLRENVIVQDSAQSSLACTVEPGTEPAMCHLILEPLKGRSVTAFFKAGISDARGIVTLSQEHALTYDQGKALEVVSADLAGSDDEGWYINVQFSEPVAPNELNKYLKLLDGKSGNVISYEVQSEEPEAVLTLAPQTETGLPLLLKVVVESGLSSINHAVLKQPFEKKFRTQAKPFQINNYWWRNWRGQREGAALYVQFSQPVKPSILKDYLSFDPPLKNMSVVPDYGNGVEIYGDWVSKQPYEMVVKPGLPLADEKTLTSALQIHLETTDVQPYIGFGYEGRFYFPRQAAVPLKIESRNVARARATLYRMFPSNIAVALKDMNNGDANWEFNDAWAEQLAEIELPLTPGRDTLVETPVNVEELFLKNTRGVFCLEVRNVEDSQDYSETEARKIIVWTDMGVLAYWQKDGLALFVHDLYSLAPVSSAAVTVYSTKNQVLATAHTNANGMALLSDFSPLLGEPSVVVVEHENDYTFLDLVRREDDPVAYTDGMPAYDRKGYDAFLYADRELYRPGETAHVHWIVRSNYGDAVGAIPLQVRVLKPNGRILLEKPVELSALGTGGLDLETQQSYPTGKYTVELLVPAAKKFIGSYTFRLEDFVPNRIKVDVSLQDAFLRAGANHTVQLSAQHLFGAPAADRKAELTLVLLRGATPPTGWEQFRFENDSSFTPDTFSAGETRTDEHGIAQFTLNYPISDKLTFPVRAVVVGRAFELGGRAVANSVERTLYPSETSLGLAVAPRTQGPGVDVAVAAVSPDGSPANLAEVKVTLEKQVWNYYVRRYYTHHETNWAESFEPVETRAVSLTNGKGTTSFEIRDYGYYRVRVHSETTPQYSTQSFFSCAGQCSLVDATRPSLIKLVVDKNEYVVGDTVRARIESPFDGKGVVVMQGETIQKIATVDIRDGVGWVEFDLTRDQVPNVWLEATVVHALQADRAQVYPFSSFAMANVPVRDPVRKIDVGFLDLPEEILPASEATFTVETKFSDGSPAETEVTLAAVDEGIHAITNYQSPNPYAWLFRDRKPDFNRAHYYDRVAYDFEKPAPGGDLEALLGKRTASPDENWIKPLSLWSGTVQTDASGKATVRFTLPEFTGQLRLVAVACSSAAVGAAEGHVYVRRPYLLRVSMPRFVLPEDTFRCRAIVFNTQQQPVKARISWAASGSIRSGEGSVELPVPPQGEANGTAEFTAGLVPGQGNIHWEAVITDESGKELQRLVQDAPLPVRAPAAYQTTHDITVLKPGESRKFTNTAFLDDERVEMHIAVSANPLLRLGKALNNVVGYPYGCVEQVTSQLFPIYLLRQQIHLFDLQTSNTDVARLADADKVQTYLNAGISRLFSMQTTEGGLSVWPGNDSAYDYGSVYALHFLSLVKRDRQLTIPEDSYRALQRYVRRIALDWTKNNPEDLYTRAYALYALALGGDLEALQQIQRFDAVTVPRPARYLLAAALAANTQNTDRVKMYLSTAPTMPYLSREAGGNLNSELRAKAVEFLALTQIGATPQELAQAADDLCSRLAGAQTLTTQEAAFAIAALSGYLAASAQDVTNASARITTPEAEKEIRGGEVFRGEHKGPDAAFSVANTGKTPLYINTTVSGVPMQANQQEIQQGIQAHRALFTQTGNLIDNKAGITLKQGQTYVLGIRLVCDRDVENVVVVDLLPAGLEIENPRIDADAIPGEAFKGAATPSHVEIRDDRLVLAFDALKAGKYQYYYVVRAVTPGKYQHPPLVAECMYDPSVKGASLVGQLEITE